MSDSFFIDTNVLLYSIDDSRLPNKKEIALSLLRKVGWVSPQVIFEFLNVCLKKLSLDKQTSLAHISSIRLATILQPETDEVINKALLIFDKYLLQSFDCKIVASALEAGCKTLYSEDMQHGLVIENSLTIINPFLKPHTH